MPELITCQPEFLGQSLDFILRYLEETRKLGANGVRIFLNGIWHAFYWEGEDIIPRKQFARFPYIINRWAYSQEFGKEYPVFREEWDEEGYFNFLLTIINQLKRLDETLHASLFDYCSIKSTGITRLYSPWYGLRYNYGGGEFYADNQWPCHEKWIRKILGVLLASGVRLKVETMNEFNGWWKTGEELVAWHKRLVALIILLGVPKEDIYYSGPYWPELQAQVGFYCHHGIVAPEIYDEYIKPEIIGRPKHEIFLSGDGGWNGRAPAGYYGRRGLGIEDAKPLANKIIDGNHPGKEYFDHTPRFFGEDAGYGEMGYTEPLHELGMALGTIPNKDVILICDISDKLKNEYCPGWKEKEFWPWEELPPVCDVHKKPEPPPPPERSCWYYFWRLNWKRWWKCLFR